MKHRPSSIRMIAMFYGMASLTILTEAIWQSHGSVALFVSGLLPLRAVLMTGTAIVALGIWSVRPWGYYSFLGFSVAMIGYQLVIYLRDSQSAQYVSLMSLIGATAGIAYFIQKHVAAPYFNPKLRWWETPPRVNSMIPAELQGPKGYEPVTIVDMSRTGCLISSSLSFRVGELLFLKISYLGFQIFVMTKIVRQCDDSRKGYGLMFLDLSREDRMVLKRIMGFSAERSRAGDSVPEENAQAV